MKMLWAPWTKEQVDKLNDFQKKGEYHPFTCPGGGHCPSRELKATIDGWVCACGLYEQSWCYDFMAGQTDTEGD